MKSNDFRVGLVRAVVNGDEHIVEVTRVPKGVIVAIDGGRVINITCAGKDLRLKNIAANAAVAVKISLLDTGGFLRSRPRRKNSRALPRRRGKGAGAR